VEHKFYALDGSSDFSQHEKNNFSLYKRFLMEKMAQFHQISKRKNSKLPGFNGNFQ